MLARVCLSHAKWEKMELQQVVTKDYKAVPAVRLLKELT